MNIKVSSSFEKLMKRVDCEVYIVSCYLAKKESLGWISETDLLSEPKKDVQVNAVGIWERETHKLKLLVQIPEDNISTDTEEENVREEYGAIYFFSSRGNQDEATFAIYKNQSFEDLELSLGNNLIDIEFPSDYLGNLVLADTSQDTNFLETFGQYPGKNIYTTKNEDIIVSKNTYYLYWRLEVTKDRETQDLPLLDENGKMIVSNYRYRVYSNLSINTPGALRTVTPNTRYGLSDDGGTVSIIGTADFIEYTVWGDTIKEGIHGKTTIESIPGSEIVYLSGHNDLGMEVDEVHNIFTINNYSSLIDYIPKENPNSYGADGIFGLRVSYYDVREQKPVTITSYNQIQLVRRERSDSWFVINSSTSFLEYTQEYGNVPVFMFPYNTDGTGYFTIRTRFSTPISNISQLQITPDDPYLNELFSVGLNLEPYVDTTGTYYVDIRVSLTALTTNTDTTKWAPIVDGESRLLGVKISYGDYFEYFYMVQCPQVDGLLKLVDGNGNTVNQIVLGYGASQGTYYLVADPETQDLGERTSWKIIDTNEDIVYSRTSGLLSGQVQTSYAPENTVLVSYPYDSPTAQDIILPDIVIARLKTRGIDEDLNTTTDWRVLVDIAQIHVGFKKLGREIQISTTPVYAISTEGIGLYGFSVRSNCRFTLSGSDSKYTFREQGSLINGNPLESPSYNDPRYANQGTFNYWIQVNTVTATTSTTLLPALISAQEGDRSAQSSLVINQGLVSSDLDKLGEDNKKYSSGKWELVYGLNNLVAKTGVSYKDTSWIKMSEPGNGIPEYNSTVTYSKGDVVRGFLLSTNPVHLYDPTVTYSAGDYVYTRTNGIEWWRFVGLSPVVGSIDVDLTPHENSAFWVNMTQFFVSLEDQNLGYPLSIDSGSWWREIPSTYTLESLEDRVTYIQDSKPYSQTVTYGIGDLVEYSGSYYISKGDLNLNYEPGVDTDWWRDISDCQTIFDIGANEIDSGDFYRMCVVRKEDVPFRYIRNIVTIYTEEVLPTFQGVDDLWELLGENQSLTYLLENPQLFKSGTSLRVWWERSRSVFDPEHAYYIYITRDSSWVELSRLEDLRNILGEDYNEQFFYESPFMVDGKELKEKLEHSLLLPSLDYRQIYLSYNYETTLNPNDISIDVVPYVGTIDNLPEIAITPAIFNLMSFRRVKDGGRMKIAITSEAALDYKGIWNESIEYVENDIVSVSDGLDSGYIYYKCVHSNTGNPPSTNTPFPWQQASWTLIPGVDNRDTAIEYARVSIGLSTLDGINFVGEFPESTDPAAVSRTEIGRGPRFGEVIRVGSSYYYCGFSWNLQTIQSKTMKYWYDSGFISGLNSIISPDLIKRYGSVIFFKTESDQDRFYYTTPTIIFNNVKTNSYIFVPKYTTSLTDVKFFSRKTPNEELVVRDETAWNDIIVIAQSSTPIFNELDSEETDHYILHTLGLRYEHEEITLNTDDVYLNATL